MFSPKTCLDQLRRVCRLRASAAAVAFLLLACFLPLRSSACRYNVRDVGFVDLETGSYRLCGFADNRTPPGVVAQFEETAQQALRETNVRVETVNVDTHPDHPDRRYRPAGLAAGSLAAVLVSPDGPALAVDLPPADTARPAALSDTLNGLVASPLRAAIVDAVSRTFGAIERVRGHMKSLPKAIAEPPVLLALAPADLAQERVLLWTLRLDTQPASEPRAAIFYGRARWIGPVMRGEEISVRNLVGVFSIIGADCECGLDLAWTQGTRLPVHWDTDRHARVAKALGFDPENPEVKTEVSWILERRSPSPRPAGEREPRNRPGMTSTDPGGKPTAPEPPLADGGSTPLQPGSPAQDRVIQPPGASASVEVEGGSALLASGRALGVLAVVVLLAGGAILLRAARQGRGG